MTKKNAPPVDTPTEVSGSFADEMSLLGVKRLERDEIADAEALGGELATAPPQPVPENEEDEFLQALGALDVQFSDRFPEEEQPPTASARRLKQLKQGKFFPDASLDLHGCRRDEVAAKLRFFLQDSHPGLKIGNLKICR